jgi:hypothetical protein
LHPPTAFGKKESVFVRLKDNHQFQLLNDVEVSDLSAAVDGLRKQYAEGATRILDEVPKVEALKVGQRVWYPRSNEGQKEGRIIHLEKKKVVVRRLDDAGGRTDQLALDQVRLPIGLANSGPPSKYTGKNYRLARDHHRRTTSAVLALLRGVDSDNAMCGTQYLFSRHKLLLHVEGLPARVEPGKTYTVSIVNLTDKKCKASRLSIWIGVRGPELQGGAAVPDENTCSWSYEVKVNIAGEYVLDVRLLHWDGHLDFDMEQCKFTKGLAYDMTTATVVHTEPRNKGRFYGNERACCELCTRMAPFNGCKYWTWWSLEAPGGKKHLDKPKCALFSKIGKSSTDETEAKENKIVSGVARTEEVKMYLGSAMPFHYKWCRREDELVSLRFTAAEAADDADASAEPAAAGIGAELDGTVDVNTTPLCKGLAGGQATNAAGAALATSRHHGRWVSFEKKARAECNEGKWARSYEAWPCCHMMFQTYDPSHGGGWCWLGRKSKPVYNHCETCPIEPQYIETSSAGDSTAVAAPMSSPEPGMSGWYHWVPHECHYKILEQTEVQACMDTLQVKSVGIKGDSLIGCLEPAIKVQ